MVVWQVWKGPAMDDRHTHRNQVKAASGIDIFVAAWLFISPWVLPLGPGVSGSNWIVGAIVVVLAAIRAFGAYGASGLSWINALLGLWVLLSPWFLVKQATDAALWNNILTGAAIIILAGWSAIATQSEPHHQQPAPLA
jgi:hypothetical protein